MKDCADSGTRATVAGRVLHVRPRRNGNPARIDTQGTRIAAVSNFKFEDASAENPLKP